MSLILIERLPCQLGHYYKFTNLATQTERKWTPPKSYSKKDIHAVLELIGRQMDTDDFSNDKITGTEEIQIIPTKDMTLEDFINLVFMPRKAMLISENTRSCWEGVFKKHVIPMLGRYTIEEITSLQLTDYMLYLQQLGLKLSTRNKHYTILQSVFKMLYSLSVIDESPLSRVERPRNYKSQNKELLIPQDNAFSVDEISYIFKCMESEPFEYQVMFQVMCETGIRRGECCALQWEDIHFDTQTITIRGNLCYTPQKGVYMDTPKNGKMNTVFISQATVDMLRELKILNLCFKKSPYVFTQKNSDKPIHPQTPTKYFDKLSKRYGINHMHPHKIRHTFASIALSKGADAVSVAKLLGHASIEVLLRYYVSTDLTEAKKTSEIIHSAISENR